MQSKMTSVMTTPKCPGAQIWQIYPRSVGRSNPLILTSSGQECQLADLPQICWQIYPPVLTSNGQEWQFHIATVTANIGRSTGRSTPCQSSIDALSTITPNLADLLADLPPIN